MHAIKPSFARSFGNHLALGIAITALLVAKWCHADTATQTDNRTGKTVKCTIVYINGDAVITCPKGAR